MSNWFSKHLGFKLDGHSLANAVKNLSPVVGTVLGGPLGLAAAGGLSALGDLGRGKNIGEAVKGGLGNAALAAGGQAVGSHFGYHGGLGSLTSSGAPAVTTPATGPVGAPPPAVASATPVAGANPFDSAGHIIGGSFDTSSGLGAKLNSVGSFVEHNPNATAMGLNALGGLATSGAKNREANAQANLLEQQADETAYDFMKRKQREQDMAPLWGSLGTAIGHGYSNVAKNPYLPGA